MSLDSTSPSEKFVNYAFTEVADGESKLIQDDLNVYLIQKLDILERPEIYDENRDVFLNALFDESFTSLLNERLSETEAQSLKDEGFEVKNPTRKTAVMVAVALP